MDRLDEIFEFLARLGDWLMNLLGLIVYGPGILKDMAKRFG